MRDCEQAQVPRLHLDRQNNVDKAHRVDNCLEKVERNLDETEMDEER